MRHLQNHACGLLCRSKWKYRVMSITVLSYHIGWCLELWKSSLMVVEMVPTTLQYLARDKLYEVEKPYTVIGTAGARSTNYIFANEPVTIQVIRDDDEFKLDTNGFCVIRSSINLDPMEALMNPEAAETGHLQELEAILGRHFPEYVRWEPLQFVVSILSRVSS